jgi:nucleotide-binding universal stress UspA family protein
MIVIGSKGLTGIKHLVMGSVAERIVHFAKIPVTVVKARS